jgi:hypothetical protein
MPHLRIDPVGLNSRRASQCCNDARTGNLDLNPNTGQAAGGFVICCNGYKVACLGRSILLDQSKGGRIIADCIIEHEKSHFPDITCPTCCRNPPDPQSRPPFDDPSEQPIRECLAAKIEVDCLQRKLQNCGADQTCVTRVQGRIVDMNKHANTLYPQGCR